MRGRVTEVPRGWMSRRTDADVARARTRIERVLEAGIVHYKALPATVTVGAQAVQIAHPHDKSHLKYFRVLTWDGYRKKRNVVEKANYTLPKMPEVSERMTDWEYEQRSKAANGVLELDTRQNGVQTRAFELEQILRNADGFMSEFEHGLRSKSTPKGVLPSLDNRSADDQLKSFKFEEIMRATRNVPMP